MNKLTKGAIAGAAGVALLLGGAGTFALWNSSAGVSDAAVATGTLTLAAATTGTWADVTKTGTPTSLTSAPTIVPGDTVTFSQTVTVVGSGQNLSARLAFNQASLALPSNVMIGGVSTPPVTVTMAASAPATNSNTATIGPDQSGVAANAGTFIITPKTSAGGSSTFNVVFTIAFNPLVANTDTQSASFNLKNASVTLTQIDPRN